MHPLVDQRQPPCPAPSPPCEVRAPCDLCVARPWVGPHSTSLPSQVQAVCDSCPAALLQGVCAQIMGVPPSFLASPSQGKQTATWPYPPTIFVHMARDESTSRAVQADMEQLHKLVSSSYSAPLRSTLLSAGACVSSHAAP